MPGGSSNPSGNPCLNPSVDSSSVSSQGFSQETHCDVFVIRLYRSPLFVLRSCRAAGDGRGHLLRGRVAAHQQRPLRARRQRDVGRRCAPLACPFNLPLSRSACHVRRCSASQHGRAQHMVLKSPHASFLEHHMVRECICRHPSAVSPACCSCGTPSFQSDASGLASLIHPETCTLV